MYIVAGLGNPENKYAGTRHNIGFSAVTAIADKYGISFGTREHKALCGKGMIEGSKVLLAQPQTYMNLSGESIRELVDFYKADPATELIVIYDDIDLDTGRLRIRAKGSAGGHNGIKSIINCLGSEEFMRIRIGVGGKPDGWDLADHVLARFPKEDEQSVRDALAKTVEACVCIMEDGINAAMNKFN